MKVKTIDVDAKEWFDRVYGNSYFAGIVTVNYGMKTEKSFLMPFQYGYGNTFEYRALDLLESEKVLPYAVAGRGLWSFCKDNGIILRSNIETGCKQRELTNLTV